MKKVVFILILIAILSTGCMSHCSSNCAGLIDEEKKLECLVACFEAHK